MTQYGIKRQEIMGISLNYVRLCLSILLSVLLSYYEKHTKCLKTMEDKVKMANCFAVLMFLAFLTIDFGMLAWDILGYFLFLVVHIMSTYVAAIVISLLGPLMLMSFQITSFVWNMDFDRFVSLLLVLSLLSVAYTICIRGKVKCGRLKNVAITSMLTLLFILSTMINIQIPMIR